MGEELWGPQTFRSSLLCNSSILFGQMPLRAQHDPLLEGHETQLSGMTLAWVCMLFFVLNSLSETKSVRIARGAQSSPKILPRVPTFILLLYHLRLFASNFLSRPRRPPDWSAWRLAPRWNQTWAEIEADQTWEICAVGFGISHREEWDEYATRFLFFFFSFHFHW